LRTVQGPQLANDLGRPFGKAVLERCQHPGSVWEGPLSPSLAGKQEALEGKGSSPECCFVGPAKWYREAHLRRHRLCVLALEMDAALSEGPVSGGGDGEGTTFQHLAVPVDRLLNRLVNEFAERGREFLL
jgi:hypothetical protein